METDRAESVTGRGKKSGWKLWLRRVFVAAVLSVLLGIALVAAANFAAVHAGRGRLFDEISEVPARRVGLVFGCDPRFQGRENLYFRYRIDAAAELWKAGKVRCLIVSGDNRSSRYYNEPKKMKSALVKLGVPADRIVCDGDGLRTLDSVFRAKDSFGTDEITFISQRFQNERAAYLAKSKGMTFSGYNARDVEGQGGLKTKVREVGARVKMWLDVNVLGTRPKKEGDKIALPE